MHTCKLAEYDIGKDNSMFCYLEWNLDVYSQTFLGKLINSVVKLVLSDWIFLKVSKTVITKLRISHDRNITGVTRKVDNSWLNTYKDGKANIAESKEVLTETFLDANWKTNWNFHLRLSTNWRTVNYQMLVK